MSYHKKETKVEGQNLTAEDYINALAGVAPHATVETDPIYDDNTYFSYDKKWVITAEWED